LVTKRRDLSKNVKSKIATYLLTQMASIALIGGAVLFGYSPPLFRRLQMQTFLSDRQVAERYSVNRVTVWRWIHREGKGFPKPVRLMNSTRWKLADLISWEATQ
jgi:predicted DNA-binding transcriptional regulator AlpA